MENEPQDKKTFISYFTKKIVVGLSVITTLLGIVAGIWAFEVHYATNKRVDGVVKVAAKEVKDLDLQVASALQNQMIQTDIRFYQFMDDKLREDQYRVRKQIENNPTDAMLQRDYDDIQKRREKIQNKIDESMRKMVN